eukprot:385443-Amorphochlora_amoeboformis.AAC.1
MIQPEGQAQGQGQGEGRSVEDIGGDSSKGSSKGSSLVKGEEHPFCPPSVPPGSSKHGVKAVIKRGVGYIFLDRGEKLNAVNSIMLTRLGDILTEWYAEERVRAVVMKSTTSRAFSAGVYSSTDMVVLYINKHASCALLYITSKSFDVTSRGSYRVWATRPARVQSWNTAMNVTAMNITLLPSRRCCKSTK